MKDIIESVSYQEKIRSLGDCHDYVAMVGVPSAFTANPGWTHIPFNQVAYDPMKMWDNTQKVYVIPFSGLWSVSMGLSCEPLQNTYRHILQIGTPDDVWRYRLYDGRPSGTVNAVADKGGMYGSREVYLPEGALLRPMFYHNVGGARAYPYGETALFVETFFSIRAISKFVLEKDLT